MSNDTKCQLEYILEAEKLQQVEDTKIASFLQMSYDIECFSCDPTKFPVPEEPKNKVI